MKRLASGAVSLLTCFVLLASGSAAFAQSADGLLDTIKGMVGDPAFGSLLMSKFASPSALIGGLNQGSAPGNAGGAGAYGASGDASADNYGNPYGNAANPNGSPAGASFGNSGPGFGNTGSGFNNAGSNFGNTGSNFGNAGSNFGNAGSNFGNAGSNFNNAGSNFNNAGSNFGNAGSNFNNAGSNFGNAGSGFGNTGPGFGNTGSGSGNTGSGFNNTGSNFNNTGSNFGNAGSNFNNAGSNFGNAGSNFNNAGSNVNNAGSNFNNAGSNFGNAGSNVGNAGSGFGNTGPSFNNSGSGYDNSNALASANSPVTFTNRIAPAELKQLSRYDISVLIDKSGSMSTSDCPNQFNMGHRISRWEWCREQSSLLTQQTSGALPAGISVVPFSSGWQRFSNVTPDGINGIFNTTSPNGSTNLAGALQSELERYFFEREHGARQRPFMIAVITDGVPDSKSAVRRVIHDATLRMTRPDEIKIVFFMIGEDQNGADFIDDLPQHLASEGAPFNIVSQHPFMEVNQLGLARSLAMSAVQQ